MEDGWEENTEHQAESTEEEEIAHDGGSVDAVVGFFCGLHIVSLDQALLLMLVGLSTMEGDRCHSYRSSSSAISAGKFPSRRMRR